MIDFHSHILPSMDDGSSDVAESVTMLKSLSQQGITKVVATPHFYANDESVSEFLERRLASFKKLENAQTEINLQIYLGAEVKFYEGISRLPDLDKLCVQGTELLLIEMPMKKWTEYILKELADISRSGKYIVILAHVERYLGLQSKETIERLLFDGVLFQVNASFFNGIFTKRKALRMLKNREIHFLGSDCHNMADRAPDIGNAYHTIAKKLGKEFAENFTEYSENMLT